jgi:5-methyltetrahydropteroyltriglutamate--homocysteine methyltransferase
MLHSRERILTTHCGSLPRPEALTQMYADRAAGRKVDEAALAELGRQGLNWVVPQQIASGIDIGNNGEQQREAFFLYVRHRMSGFGGAWNRRIFADVARYAGFRAQQAAAYASTVSVSNTATVPQAIGEVKYLDRAFVEAECSDFRAALDANGGGFAEPFFTAPSPGIIAAAMLNAFYDSEQAYLDALGEALRVEYETIVRHGFLLQIDAPDLAMERHMTYQDRPLSDFLAFVERVVGTINRALVNIPRDRVRLHVCWGNYEGPHDSDVPLEDILPILRQADAGALVLPFANPRHAHEYHVLERQKLADDQIIVAGVIDPLTNFVEHPEVVAERIERVARAVGDPARVIAGVDCGFDTSAGRGKVADDVVWAKMTAMAGGARIASGRLF